MGNEENVIRWHTKYGSTEIEQRVRLTESFDYFLNPHKGTTTYQRFNGEAAEPIDGGWNDAGPRPRPPFGGINRNAGYTDTTVIYMRWLWKTFEPVQGKRNWKLLDEYLKTAGERGQTVQFRMNTYDVGFEDWWYWKTGAKKDPATGEPDVNDPNWFKYFGDTIRELGKRYDGHPLLDTVDTVYGGMWGESGGNATKETCQKFIDLYMKVFKKTKLMVMEGDDALAYAAKKKLGWRADCFGDLRSGLAPNVIPDHLCFNHTYDRYPYMVFKAGCQDNWKYGPVTMETCWTVGYWYQKGWDLDFIIDQGLKMHTTYFMPKSCGFPDSWMGKLVDFNKKLGYRFIPRQIYMPLRVKRGKSFEMNIWMDNNGCAPIYRDYKFALRVTQGKKQAILPFKVDIRTWLPGYTCFNETVKLPAWVEQGNVDFDIALIDADNKPKVRFAVKEIMADGWHPAHGITVTA